MTTLLAVKYEACKAEVNARFEQLRANEEELNRIFAKIYNMEGEVPIEITHDYDPSSYELEYAPTGYTEEELSGGDLSGYTGCWKLENEPFYFVINE